MGTRQELEAFVLGQKGGERDISVLQHSKVRSALKECVRILRMHWDDVRFSTVESGLNVSMEISWNYKQETGKAGWSCDRIGARVIREVGSYYNGVDGVILGIGLFEGTPSPYTLHREGCTKEQFFALLTDSILDPKRKRQYHYSNADPSIKRAVSAR